MRQYSDVLAQNPLFAGMDAAQVEALVTPGATQAAYRRGEVILGPSSDMRVLGFMLRGSALVYRPGAGATPLLMSRLGPPSAFGMASLFDAHAQPTEILAEQACRVLLWPKARVEEAFQREPALVSNYIALLSERIHFLNRRIDALAGDDLRTRLLRLLEGLQGTQAAGEPFTLPYSLSQLAALLGVGRASLYRTLDALEAEGSLLREGRYMTLIHNQKEETP